MLNGVQFTDAKKEDFRKKLIKNILSTFANGLLSSDDSNILKEIISEEKNITYPLDHNQILSNVWHCVRNKQY